MRFWPGISPHEPGDVRLRVDRVGAVLFDMDGVLIDTDAAIARLWQRAGALVGRRLSGDELRAHVLGCAPEHALARLFGTYPEQDQRRLLAEIRAGEPDLTPSPLPGATGIVRALAAAGVPLALVTSASAGRAAAVIEMLGITDCFRARVTWGDADRGKPDPQPYLIAADRLGIEPAGCTVFEDSVNGVRAAVAAGTTCIGIDRRGAQSPLWSAGATSVMAALTHIEVAGSRSSP